MHESFADKYVPMLQHRGKLKKRSTDNGKSLPCIKEATSCNVHRAAVMVHKNSANSVFLARQVSRHLNKAGSNRSLLLEVTLFAVAVQAKRLFDLQGTRQTFAQPSSLPSQQCMASFSTLLSAGGSGATG